MSTGFHYTRYKGDVGYKVPASSLEDAQPLVSGKSYGSWRYSEDVPDSGKIQEVYWFSQKDFEYLMQKDAQEVKRLARLHGWRYRRNTTTKSRQFYLFDVLATVWLYMTDYYGHNIDLDLLEEARERNASRPGVLP